MTTHIFRSALFFGFLSAMAIVSTAQESRGVAVEGYITSLSPNGFDVNAEHVAILPDTTFGMIGDKHTATDSPLHDAVQVGAYVEVVGPPDGHAKTVKALKVLFRDDWDKKLSGFAVIDRVISTGSAPVFEADGYRVRVTSATETSFTGSLKSLADAGTNVWMRFEGKRNKEGVLVASKADFLPPKPAKFKAASGLEVYSFPFRPANSSAKAAPASQQGDLPLDGGKVKFGLLGGWHTIPADRALQDRVQRIGLKLVPAYQSQLASDDGSRIHFRFYAVEDNKFREEICSSDGLILVPLTVIERLNSDDEIAAVLASGIAANLQRQAARAVNENRVLLGGEIASQVAAAFVPGLDIAYWVGESVAANKIKTAMEEERGRVALALMANAGYDPWQAPEAWRLLAPRHLPQNVSSLKYPSRSGYQLGILNLQYKRAPAPNQPTVVAQTPTTPVGKG